MIDTILLLIIVMVLIITPPITPNNGNQKEYNIEVSPQYIDYRIANTEQPTLEFIIDDWGNEVYYPKQREMTSSNLDETELFDRLLFDFMTTHEVESDFYSILMSLNPYKTVSGVYKNSLNYSYGISQINLKLIPLATLYYENFETSIESQLLFLNVYIKTKKNKNYLVDKIVNMYKLCDY